MTTRRIALWILLPAIALAAVVAGCGGGGGAGAGKTAKAQNVSGSVSVMGIWVGEEQKSFQAVIAVPGLPKLMAGPRLAARLSGHSFQKIIVSHAGHH